MNKENSNNQKALKTLPKEVQSVRAEKALETIRLTINLNEKLQKIGAVSNNFGLRKVTAR